MTPENLHLLPLYILGGVVGCWLLIAFLGALPLLSLSKVYLEPVSEEEADENLQKVLSSERGISSWAIEHAFEPVGVFQAKNIPPTPILVGWRQVQSSTYLCAYVIFGSRIEMDIVSSFGEGSHLSTGTTRDGQLIPTSPSNWLQSFSVSDVSELWQHHQAALEFLNATANVQPIDRGTTLEEDFLAAVQLQSKYIRSIPLWFLRIPYWYFVRRFTRHNKPLAELT